VTGLQCKSRLVRNHGLALHVYISHSAAYPLISKLDLKGKVNRGRGGREEERRGERGWAKGQKRINHPRHKIFCYGLKVCVSFLPLKCRANPEFSDLPGFIQCRKRRPAAIDSSVVTYYNTSQYCLSRFQGKGKEKRKGTEGKRKGKERIKVTANTPKYPQNKIIVTATLLPSPFP